MTTPKIGRIRDWVLSRLQASPEVVLLPVEANLANHLRGNAPLYEAIVSFLQARLNGRAQQPVPNDPIDCRASMERDAEVRTIVNRLDLLYRSPVNQAAEAGEPPV